MTYFKIFMTTLFLLIDGISQPLVTVVNEDVLSAPMKKALSTLGQESSMSPQDALAFLSENYGRKGAEERHDIKKNSALEEKRIVLMPLFSKMGMIEEQTPLLRTYSYISILGATIDRMTERILFLNDLILKKRVDITPETRIYVLAGDRPLFDSEKKAGYASMKTEFDAAVDLVEHLNLIPALKKQIKVLNTPKRFDEATKKWVRPHTGNTITTLLREVGNDISADATFLFVSNNPYVPYQHAIVSREFIDQGLPFDKIETIGAKTSDGLDLSNYLDNLRNTLQREMEVAQRLSALQ